MFGFQSVKERACELKRCSNHRKVSELKRFMQMKGVDEEYKVNFSNLL